MASQSAPTGGYTTTNPLTTLVASWGGIQYINGGVYPATCPATGTTCPQNVAPGWENQTSSAGAGGMPWEDNIWASELQGPNNDGNGQINHPLILGAFPCTNSPNHAWPFVVSKTSDSVCYNSQGLPYESHFWFDYNPKEAGGAGCPNYAGYPNNIQADCTALLNYYGDGKIDLPSGATRPTGTHPSPDILTILAALNRYGAYNNDNSNYQCVSKSGGTWDCTSVGLGTGALDIESSDVYILYGNGNNPVATHMAAQSGDSAY